MPPKEAPARHSDASIIPPCVSEIIPGSTSVSSPLNISPWLKKAPLKTPPKEPPPFTRDSIKAMIPAHCFERNVFTSFSHLISDLVQVLLIGYAATYISSAPLPAQFVLWPLYWYVQGCVMTGIWVLAHECGHQAFSDSEFINDTTGWVLHSALLVPYHSWRITHKNHHSNTCSVEKDEVFAPSTFSDYSRETMNDVPIVILWNIFVMLTFGW